MPMQQGSLVDQGSLGRIQTLSETQPLYSPAVLPPLPSSHRHHHRRRNSSQSSILIHMKERGKQIGEAFPTKKQSKKVILFSFFSFLVSYRNDLKYGGKYRCDAMRSSE